MDKSSATTFTSPDHRAASPISFGFYDLLFYSTSVWWLICHELNHVQVLHFISYLGRYRNFFSPCDDSIWWSICVMTSSLTRSCTVTKQPWTVLQHKIWFKPLRRGRLWVRASSTCCMCSQEFSLMYSWTFYRHAAAHRSRHPGYTVTSRTQEQLWLLVWAVCWEWRRCEAEGCCDLLTRGQNNRKSGEELQPTHIYMLKTLFLSLLYISITCVLPAVCCVRPAVGRTPPSDSPPVSSWHERHCQTSAAL